MNAYENILEFKGTWRNYQDRVLKASDSYLSDKKIHIVAAPGAGKTPAGDRIDPKSRVTLSDPLSTHRDSPAVVRKNRT